MDPAATIVVVPVDNLSEDYNCGGRTDARWSHIVTMLDGRLRAIPDVENAQFKRTYDGGALSVHFTLRGKKYAYGIQYLETSCTCAQHTDSTVANVMFTLENEMFMLENQMAGLAETLTLSAL
jgi:hypothetical protein